MSLFLSRPVMKAASAVELCIVGYKNRPSAGVPYRLFALVEIDAYSPWHKCWLEIRRTLYFCPIDVPRSRSSRSATNEGEPTNYRTRQGFRQRTSKSS